MKLSLIKPLSALLASLMMCLFLIASHSTKAHSNHQNIQIIQNGDITKTLFEVNGKRFVWQDLTNEQQQSLREYFTQMDSLEAQLDKTTSIIDLRSEEIESKVDLLEQQIEEFVDARNNNIEAYTAQLESEIAEIEKSMPQVDQALIRMIEDKAEDIDQLLIRVSETLE